MIYKYFKYAIPPIAAFATICSFGMSYFWENVSDNGAKVCWYRHIDIADYWNQAQTEPFNNIFFLILFCGLCFSYFKTLKIVKDNRRLVLFSVFLAALFSSFEVVGHSFAAVSGLDEILNSKHDFIKSVIRCCGYIPLFFSCIVFVTIKIIPKISGMPTNNNFFPCYNKKNFIIISTTIFISYSIFLTKYWPMVYGYDTLEYINQVFYPPLDNHHAVFNSWVIAPFIKLGLLIGNVNMGIFIAELIQLGLISITTAFAMISISRLNIPRIVRIIAVVFYFCYPPYAYFAACIGKDTPFGYTTLVFVLCLLQISINKENFFKSRLHSTLFIISPILMMLHRNNGFHVLLLSAPFLIWKFKDIYRKRMIIWTIAVVIFQLCWNCFIFNVCEVKPYSDMEKYSLISQQLARISKTENINIEEKDEIEKYIICSTTDLASAYLPEISDPTKALLDMQTINSNLSSFLCFSVKMMIKYPKTSIEGFLNTTYGYWNIEYIETLGGPGSLQGFPIHNPIIDSMSQKQLFYNPIAEIEEKTMKTRNIPIINTLFRTGFIIWIMIYCFGYCWYSKKYNIMVMFAPLFAILLICIASPYITYRYIFGIVTSLPVIISSIFAKMPNQQLG